MPTLAELRARVRLDRALKGTTFFSTDNLDILLKEGALQLANDGDAFILGSDTWNGVASAQTYVLSGASPKVTNFLDIYWPAGGLVYKPTSSVTKTAPNDFTIVSEAWLNLHIPGWQDATASDTLQHAYLSHDSSGHLLLGVYPKTSTTTPTFKLYYKSRGTDMSAAANYPWMDSTTNLVHTEPYQVGIAYYALWKAHETFTLNQSLALHYKEAYLEQALGLREAQARIFAAEQAGLTAEAMAESADSFGGL